MDDAMAGAPTFGVVRSYDDLCLALRARAEHLNVSRETIDEVAGFQASYSAKLLATPPHRKFGSMSFNAMIQALGVKLVVLEDGDAMARLRHRLTPRQAQQVRWKPAASNPASIEAEPGVKALFMRTIAALGGKARAQKLSDKRRAAIARRAARARWSKAPEEASA